MVECTGLENRRTLTRTVGSNPTSSATTTSSFLFLVFLALFLRKIRDLEQRFATDTPHHLSYQRHFPFNLRCSFDEGVFFLFFVINREINREFFVF